MRKDVTSGDTRRGRRDDSAVAEAAWPCSPGCEAAAVPSLTEDGVARGGSAGAAVGAVVVGFGV